jgi:hypothetical protein
MFDGSVLLNKSSVLTSFMAEVTLIDGSRVCLGLTLTRDFPESFLNFLFSVPLH